MTTRSFGSRIALVLALGLGGCATARSADTCDQGTLIDTDSGAVCVFRRDAPLVIEGGFECPAGFDFRFETERAIACSEGPIDALPPAACLEMGEDCDPRNLGTEHAGPSSVPAGECYRPCTVDADCAPPVEYFQACVDGACVESDCTSTEQCRALISDPADIVCAPDGFGRKVCESSCTTRADCASDYPDQPELSQFDCVSGACTAVGCTFDETCGAHGACVDVPGPNECRWACEVAEDCEAKLASDGLFVPPEESWTGELSLACNDGWCEVESTGCPNDAACQVNDPALRCNKKQ